MAISTDEALGADEEQLPSRYGHPWGERDFAGIMQACRDGCGFDEIAARIGRTPAGLRGQLHRMLPAAERHLAASLVLPRLRQLDADGDYDWLAAMAERTIYPWEREQERERDQHEAARARGIGALPDDEVVAIAVALARSVAPEAPLDDTRWPGVPPHESALPDALLRAIQREIEVRGLGPVLTRCAERHASEAVEALLDRVPTSWRVDDERGTPRWGTG